MRTELATKENLRSVERRLTDHMDWVVGKEEKRSVDEMVRSKKSNVIEGNIGLDGSVV